MFSNKIKKLRFHHSGLGISVASTSLGQGEDEVQSRSSVEIHCDEPVHEDMDKAVEAIRLHLARICGLFGIYSKEGKDKLLSGKNGTLHLEILGRLRVKSVTYDLGEETDKPMVQIQGIWETPCDGRGIPIGTPNIFLHAAQYPYTDDLISDLDTLNSEAFAYARGEKRGGQLSLFGGISMLPIFLPKNEGEGYTHSPRVQEVEYEETEEGGETGQAEEKPAEERVVFIPKLKKKKEQNPDVAPDLGDDE